MRKLFTSFLMLFFTVMLMAQGSVTGKLVDKERQPLMYAPVTIKGTTKGVSTDFDGNFALKGIEAGVYTIVFSYVGYEDTEQEVTITNGPVDLGTIALKAGSIELVGVEVIADVAIDRKTPVAVSTISSEAIENKVGNQEFPEILKSTPSVYTTKTGGGFGDARINIRGFDQRNIAVLINGIPVNDMENGWVYWSNWAGLSDVTRTVQVQRGLGASKLAIASVGGTMNLITKTTDQKAGISAYATYGNDNYLKYGLTLSTGRLKGGWAVTLSGSKTTGEGYVDAAYIDAYSYFGSVTKEFGEKHQLVFTAFGAPQKHGQRTGRLDLDNYNNPEQVDIRANDSWGYLNGEIFNNRENFYHKPQMALTHYWDKSEKFFLATSVYYSIGRGGGTGDRGRIQVDTFPDGEPNYDFVGDFRDEEGLIDYDGLVAWNSGANDVDGFPAQGALNHEGYGTIAGERVGIIRRASKNEHNWMGALSTAKWNINDKLSLLGGIDIRSYKGLHYREVNDLLGNEYWLNPDDVNSQETMIDLNGDGEISWHETGELVKVGDKMGYDNDGLVDWEGLFTQLEYSSGGLSAFVALSGSNTGYKRVDRFQYEVGNQESERFSALGYTTKAGINYNLDKMHNIYANGGYYSRAPSFDGVFLNNANEINAEVKNEKIIGAELGYGLRAKKVAANVNFYYTLWNDKTLISRYGPDREFTANITGLNALHKGVEFDLTARPVDGLEIRGMFSVGDWEWQNNVNAVLLDDAQDVIGTVDVYAEGLKVGDAAQFTLSTGIAYEFKFGLGLDLDAYYFADLYANFDPDDRDNENLIGHQPIRLPSYGLLDGGISYRFKFNGYAVKLRFNMNNITDKFYIADADDNVGDFSVDGDVVTTQSNDRRLADSRGYYGFGRTWNIGIKFNFNK